MARKRFTFFSFIQVVFLKATRQIKRQKIQLFAALFLGVSLSLLATNVQADLISNLENRQVGITQKSDVNEITLQQQDGSEWENLARKSYAAGEFEEAAKYWQQAVSMFEVKGDWLNQAIALSNLSLTYQQLGRWEDASIAIENSQKLLPEESRVKLPVELKAIAQILDIKGNGQWEQGQINSALKTWEQAANIYVKLKDEIGWKRSLIAQVKAMQELGFYDRACQTLTPVIASDNQGNFAISNKTCEQYNSDLKLIKKILPPKLNSVNPNLKNIKLTGARLLGDVLRQVGYLDNSAKWLESVEPVISQQNLPEEKALTWLSLGNTYEALGNRNRSIYSYEKSQGQKREEIENHYKLALKNYRAAVNIPQVKQVKIQAQLNLFNLLSNLILDDSKEVRNIVNVKEIEDLSLDIVSDLSQLPLSRQKVYAEVSLMKNLANFLKNENLNSSLKPSWKEIIELGENAVKLGKDLGDARVISYALGNLGKIYEQKKQWLEAQNCTEQALLLSQNLKLNAPDLAYQWQWQLGRIRWKKEKTDIEGAIAAYTAAFNTLQSVRNDLVPISRDGQFDFRDEIEPVYRDLVDLLLQGDNPDQKNLKQAREVIEALQVAELDNFFRDACVVVNKAEEIDRIADKYDPTAAVIHAIILPNRLAIILKLPGKDSLEYRATPVSEETVRTTLRELGRDLKISGKEPDVQENSKQLYKWTIEPLEGLLKNNPVPVETLVFVLDSSLQQIPMAVLLDPKNEEFLLKKYAVALAPALQLIDAKSSWKDRGSQKLKLFAGGVDEAQDIEGTSWKQIEVKTEIDAISKFVATSEPLLNENFTKENIQKQIASNNYPIVHIKTHGQFSSDPEQTFIVAYKSLLRSKDLDSLVKSGSENDRRIIELLVLSACETAKGDNRATLGLAGIAVRAGARSTLSTLWKAEDQKTTELMAKFYEVLVSGKPGMTKAKALNIAQKAFFESKNPPNIWSNYVLVGNWL